MKNLISIITVVRNDLEGIKKTFESIIRQHEFRNISWIIIDGYSEDGTFDFLQSIDSRLTLQVHQFIPTGIYPAMNEACKYVSSQYIWFINSGDILLNSDSVKIIEEEIINNNFPESMASCVAHLTPNQTIYEITYPTSFIVDGKIIVNYNHQGFLVKKKVFESLNGFDENLKFAADSKFMDQVANRFSVFESNQLQVGFAMGGTSTINFPKTVEEIQLHRKLELSRRSLYFLYLKTYIRKFIIANSNQFLLGIAIKSYFWYREKLTLAKYNRILVDNSSL